MTTINTILPPSGQPQLQPNTMGFLFKPQRCKQSHDPSFLLLVFSLSFLAFFPVLSFYSQTKYCPHSSKEHQTRKQSLGFKYTHTHRKLTRRTQRSPNRISTTLTPLGRQSFSFFLSVPYCLTSLQWVKEKTKYNLNIMREW